MFYSFRRICFWVTLRDHALSPTVEFWCVIIYNYCSADYFHCKLPIKNYEISSRDLRYEVKFRIPNAILNFDFDTLRTNHLKFTNYQTTFDYIATFYCKRTKRQLFRFKKSLLASKENLIVNILLLVAPLMKILFIDFLTFELFKNESLAG